MFENIYNISQALIEGSICFIERDSLILVRFIILIAHRVLKVLYEPANAILAYFIRIGCHNSKYKTAKNTPLPLYRKVGEERDSFIMLQSAIFHY